MSRKHYVEAADVIKRNLARVHEESPEAQAAAELAVRSVAVGLADMFKRDNGMFDRDKFYTAAGMS
jgi:hypothetical protein